MNRLTNIAFCAMMLATPALVACGGDDDPNPSGTQTSSSAITLSKEQISATTEGGVEQISVTAERGEWTAYVNDNASWISINNSNTASRQGYITITISANSTFNERTATVTVKSGATLKNITITQAAATKPEEQKDVEVTDITTPAGYTLVWNDEFSGTTTLSTDWAHERTRVNNELQNYTSGTVDGQRTVEVADGFLCINLFKGSDGKVYSGRIRARHTTGWTYGYVEARIKLPKGKGTWPAFWMMPVSYDNNTNPWPGCGEIDIMEEVGVDANQIVSTIHCKAYNHNIGTQKTMSTNVPTAESDFHVYACEWTTDYLAFFIDGKEHFRFNNDGKGNKDTWPYSYAFYPILNLAWGGDWGGYDGVDDKALPTQMKVDYVRIFQKK